MMSKDCKFIILNSNTKDTSSLKNTLTKIYGDSSVTLFSTWDSAAAKHLSTTKLPTILLLDVESDLNRLGVPSFQLLEMISLDEALSHVCVITTSKNFNEDLMSASIECGAVDHLVLPISNSQARVLWLTTKKKSRSNTKHQVIEMHHTPFDSKDFTGVVKLMAGYFNPFIEISLDSFPKVSPKDPSIIKLVKRWDFDALSLSDEQLMSSIVAIFEQLDVFDRFNLSAEKFNKFLLAVRGNYRDNQYHNFRHAVDVLQAFFYMLVNSPVMKYLKDIEILALSVASLCHDLAHPGLNNFYQVNAKTPLALLYNNKSVLENFHATATFSLLMRPELNFACDLSVSDSKIFRDIVISSILATDMSFHFDFINSIKSRVASSDVFSFEKKTDVTLMATSLVKCADISNVTRPFDTSKKWADELLAEFRMQSSLEKEMGLPILAYGAEGVNQAEGQLDFIAYVAQPLYDSMDSLTKATKSDENPFQVLLSNLKSNVIRWSDIRAQTSSTNSESSSTNTSTVTFALNKNEKVDITKKSVNEAVYGRRKSLPPQTQKLAVKQPRSPKSPDEGGKQNEGKQHSKKSLSRVANRNSHRRSRSDNNIIIDEEEEGAWNPPTEEVSAIRSFDGDASIYNRRSSVVSVESN